MSRRPPHGHRDANQRAIVTVLHQLGISTLDLSALGSGCPDIAATGGPLGSAVWLIEVKNPANWRGKRGTADAHQQAWMDAWPGPTCLLRTVDEAITWATEQRGRATCRA